MAFNPIKFAALFLTSSLASLSYPEPALAARPDPRCIQQLKSDHVRILKKFSQMQFRKYTPAKARVVHGMVEKYLIAIGQVFKNFDVKIFIREELAKLPEVAALDGPERVLLTQILTPSFSARRLPSQRALLVKLEAARLGELPVEKIHEIMDRSFKTWRTKLIYDETGESTFNKFAKAYRERTKRGELSMDVGMLSKNYWEAFFDSEKTSAIFNPSLPGILSDQITSTEAHEAVHMTVQLLASQGHESPYHFWFKMDAKLKETGAIGEKQKAALRNATDALNDGDYYRTELYLDELPAHTIQSAFLNVQLSKRMRKRFDSFVSDVRGRSLRAEMNDIYAEYLTARGGPIEWSGYSLAAKNKFEAFLLLPASDGRTAISKIIGEMNQYVLWIDLINDGARAALFEARKVVEQALEVATQKGLKKIRSDPKGPISVRKDVFLGESGYLIDVRIPTDVLQKDKTFLRRPGGASMRFRFTNVGEPSRDLTPGKIKKFMHMTDWALDLTEATETAVRSYADLLDEQGLLGDYTMADVFRMKATHTRLREISRETLEQIRATK